MPDLPETLAAFNGTGYVVAPAGHGKTYLIAASVRHAERRQLVLTHTYAGVHALRGKMRNLKVPDRSRRIDTIASWALRLSLSYPESSGWTITRPEWEQWDQLYRTCAVLLDCSFIRRILRASYGGLYVDEYQDCSSAQHDIVLKLARDIPCRILGDPLQGIFDFEGNAMRFQTDFDLVEQCDVGDTQRLLLKARCQHPLRAQTELTQRHVPVMEREPADVDADGRGIKMSLVGRGDMDTQRTRRFFSRPGHGVETGETLGPSGLERQLRCTSGICERER